MGCASIVPSHQLTNPDRSPRKDRPVRIRLTVCSATRGQSGTHVTVAHGTLRLASSVAGLVIAPSLRPTSLSGTPRTTARPPSLEDPAPTVKRRRCCRGRTGQHNRQYGFNCSCDRLRDQYLRIPRHLVQSLARRQLRLLTRTWLALRGGMRAPRLCRSATATCAGQSLRWCLKPTNRIRGLVSSARAPGHKRDRHAPWTCNAVGPTSAAGPTTPRRTR